MSKFPELEGKGDPKMFRRGFQLSGTNSLDLREEDSMSATFGVRIYYRSVCSVRFMLKSTFKCFHERMHVCD